MATIAENRTTERSASPPASGLTFTRLIPSLPIGVLNSINPFASSDVSTANGKAASRDASPAPGDSNTAFFKRPVFGAILSRPAALLGGGTTTTQAATTLSPEDARTPSHLRHGSTVMFAEPAASDSDDASREGSVTCEKRQKRSRNKPKTSYSICHPAPASLARHKLHRRPRSLLQLHRLSANNRPVPAFEVIPSANFSAKLTKSIIKTYKTRHGLCSNDLVVLRAEKYYTQEHEEEQDTRDIVALICRGRNTSISDSLPIGKAKICMSNGEEWEAYPHGTSGYEFFTTDAHGLGITVRWVQKKTRDAKPGRKKFNFSTIAQNTRKHPVIATLSDTGLDIFDTYKIPDPAISTPLSTPVNQDSVLAQAMEDEDAPTGLDECVTDERLRSIITVTSIYVAFKEGWSPYFKYDEKDASSKLSMSPQKDAPSTPLDTPPGSPLLRALDKRGSIRSSVGSGLIRRSSVLSRSNRDSTLSVDSIASNDTASTPRAGRSRADSASTVLVHRATSNRRRTNQQATWRPDLLSAQNTVPEGSREDLTRVKSSRRSSAKAVASLSSTRRPSTRKATVADDTDESDDEEEDGNDDEADEEGVSPTRKPKDDKRESSIPSDTTASERPSQKHAPVSTTKRSSMTGKKGGWKRLFCIG